MQSYDVMMQPVPIGLSEGRDGSPGMATAPTASVRRIEDWIVQTLDVRAAPPGPVERDDLSGDDSPSVAMARKALRRLAECEAEDDEAEPETGVESWGRLHVIRHPGITVVRFTDHAILKEVEISEVCHALDALSRAGDERIVLNFGTVHRMSSQVVATVARVHRRCTAAGGQLKLCGLRLERAEIFAITGLTRLIPIEPDERSALRGDWPQPPPPPPPTLPVATLLAMARRGDRAAAGAASPPPPPGPEGSSTADRAGGLPARAAMPVRLIVEVGRAKGQAVAVPGPRFLIGRDPRCQLRPHSRAISRLHTAIERRGDRVFIRDCASLNGTTLNGRELRGERAEAYDGDRLRIGPLRFTLAIRARLGDAAKQVGVEDVLAGWRLENGDVAVDACAATLLEPISSFAEPAPAHPADDIAIGAGSLEYEAIQDVLLITPLGPILDGDAAIDPLRAALVALFERPLPRRVVISLGNVSSLSSRAVGVLVAHFLRLGQAGGALRLCQAHGPVLAALEQIDLPSVVATYATAEDAVLTTWE